MSETTAHLIDNVLPKVPYRQYVVTFPHSLRFWMSTSRELTNQVHKIVTTTIMSYYKTIAEERKIDDPQAGGVTFLQRFGSALNANLHAHILVPDGVWAKASGEVKFYELPGPDDDYVSQIIEAIANATIEMLRNKGYLSEEGESVDRPDCIDDIFTDSQQLTAAVTASHNMQIAFGEHRGNKVRRIGKGFGFAEEIGLIKGKRLASANGFTLHANRFIGAQERKKLEDLISYAARGAFSHKRLSLKDPTNPQGDLVYSLKTPWKDGTQAIILTQMELIEKLVALIPPPYSHLTRYFGILASGSVLRSEIILKPNVRKGFIAVGDEGEVERMTWGKLLQRTFRLDVEHCLKCGHLIQPEDCMFIECPEAIEKILKVLGIKHHPPPIKPARLVFNELEFDQSQSYIEGD